ncbi:hypothetical protein PCC9214_01497 [Planktothrix tepida]|uniref:NYN domain-containing protein n=1 Tax=Planktothrix tepida PCC 9214 TaxID=671072 RepID=A0A1J1LHU9_9CYAN|nr:NYN domain-containing protein [Planktothrix tepida]CAD5934286.1 hypothetical protein PCC9214_01497 [Planktothrix tepida]CUR31782.1 conserved hypothetical protein [Planktothrix tepida PCC 9214]
MKTSLEILAVGVAIYADFQNVRNSPEEFKLLNTWLNLKGRILKKKGYSNWKKENQLFAEVIAESSFKIIHVPHLKKNAVDDEMIQDCKHDIMTDRSIRIVILITGDKDFLPLVEELQQLGIKVILIHGDNVSQALKGTVDEAYNINEVIASVELDKATPEQLDSPAIISYEEAKKCLIESIQTVKARGKKTTLALMGNLIKEHPQLSGYKKISYCKPDGKIVYNFSKFVDAVIQEGIIQKNCNGELTVV